MILAQNLLTTKGLLLGSWQSWTRCRALELTDIVVDKILGCLLHRVPQLPLDSPTDLWVSEGKWESRNRPHLPSRDPQICLPVISIIC